MAQGGKCPVCGYYLFIKDERWEEHGTTVWYECADRKCWYAVKTFFPKKKK